MNLRVPTAVSADGRTIVEFGEDTGGQTKAFMISGFLVNRLVNGSYSVAAGKSDAIGILGGAGTVTIGPGGALSVAGNNLSSDPANFPNSVFSGTIAGAGDLVKDGTGTWLFTGSFQSSGKVVINAGTFQLGNGGPAGSIAGDVVNNANLVINRSDAFTLVGSICQDRAPCSRPVRARRRSRASAPIPGRPASTAAGLSSTAISALRAD